MVLNTLGKLLGMKPQDLIPTVRLGGAPIPSLVGSGVDYAVARTDQQKSDAEKKLTSGMFAFIPAGVHPTCPNTEDQSQAGKRQQLPVCPVAKNSVDATP